MAEEQGQRIAGVGYINDDLAHAMISVFWPALLKADGKRFVQVAVTIQTAAPSMAS